MINFGSNTPRDLRFTAMGQEAWLANISKFAPILLAYWAYPSKRTLRRSVARLSNRLLRRPAAIQPLMASGSLQSLIIYRMKSINPSWTMAPDHGWHLYVYSFTVPYDSRSGCEQDFPMLAWLEDREDFLSKFICLEGQCGFMTCVGCNVTPASFRCHDSLGTPMYCWECIISHHEAVCYA